MLIKKQNERKTPSPWGKIHKGNMSTVNALKGIHPKYAEHMFKRNHLIEMFAKERFGGVEVLDLPMCERCERPGAWHTDDTCYCFPCGHVTPKNRTKPLREWLAQDIKEYGFSEEEMALLEMVQTEAYEGSVILDMLDSLDNMEPNNYIDDESEVVIDEVANIDTVQEWCCEDRGQNVHLSGHKEGSDTEGTVNI